MVQAIGAAVGALSGIVGGAIGGGKSRAEEKAAREEMAMNKAAYANLDTSNPYANVQNTYEDLTVNTQQADFAAQQQQQGLANTMGAMSGAAGGSGIAALAQAMAGQQSANMQQASASIGQQEAANQRMAAQGAAEAQSQRLQGEVMSRQMEADKIGTQYEISRSRFADAQAAREASKQQIVGGLQSAGNAMAGMSDRKLKENYKIIGYSPSGLKIYAFEYINKKFGEGVFQGVMSDEIPQNAVIKHPDGYDMVDYSKIDVEFKKLKL